MNKTYFQKTLEVYDSQLKQRIMNLLEIYHELSLTELSEKLSKSKSTVSKHMKELKNIKIQNHSFIEVREEKSRGSIKQKIYSKSSIPFFFGKTYDDIKQFSPEEMYKMLRNEEFLINIRLFSLLKDAITQTTEYVNNFYANVTPKTITEEFMEEVYRYNTCIPRIQYYTQDEYVEYRNKFMEFDTNFLRETEKKREKDLSLVDEPREYMVAHAFLPIRRIMDKEYYSAKSNPALSEDIEKQ